MRFPALIAKKRDGQTLTQEEIEFFVSGTVSGQIAREQIGAMLMAIYLRGMNAEETVHLTRALMLSGDVLSWDQYKGKVVDKHSTGGVGDKISLPLAPALAVYGLKVPMISGRGLGHTGGTLDKLESIPGYRVEQSVEDMNRIMSDVGCCIVGQTQTLVPGDRILYAIRDVTSTVESISLITASIVSKKVAEGLDSLVLDVKVGKAAFMKTLADARALAQSMVSAGRGNGVKTVAVLTEMDNPIGRLIGNSLEVIESVDTLKGKGPEDLVELTCELGGQLLLANGNATTIEQGRKMIKDTFHDGTALAKFKDMMVAQGVTEQVAQAVCDDPWKALPIGQTVTTIPAPASGFVSAIEAMPLAICACELGAGRVVTTDIVDHGVGLQLLAQVGEAVTEGQPLVTVYHNKPLTAAHVDALKNAFTIVTDKPGQRSRVIEIIHS